MAEPDKDELRSATDHSDHESGERNGSADVKTGNGQKSASSSKDPSRPRRKKARRACFACQRAHLTCGMSSDVNCNLHVIDRRSWSLFTFKIYTYKII